MLENAAAGGSGGRVQQAGAEISAALAKVAQSAGSSHGLAVFDKKGELSRVEGVTVFPGGVVDVKGLGPHLQHGDVDFQVQLYTYDLYIYIYIPHKRSRGAWLLVISMRRYRLFTRITGQTFNLRIHEACRCPLLLRLAVGHEIDTY